MRIKESAIAALPTKIDFVALPHNRFYTEFNILRQNLERNLGKRKIKSDY